jgi:DNA-binding response OmpR family regulator
VPANEAAGGQKMRKRVLVVDDDSSIRQSLKKVLEESGYDVLLAADGEVAVKQLSQEPIDLLLLDLEMPKLDGWDVLEGVRSGCSTLPIIMITGLAGQLETRLIPGLDALLEKPIDVAILLRKIEELLTESAMQRRIKPQEERSPHEIRSCSPGYLRLSTPEWPSHS